MRMSASGVPLAIRRRAAQHLESVRHTEIGVNARRARITDEVSPIFRPDMTEPAYYEFEVALGAVRTGFIVVSAGRHDYPVPHWSFDSEPVSRRLDALAQESGKEIARIYKLDALSYVGEDLNGQLVGQIGQLPMPVKGLPADLEQARGRITSTVAAPVTKPADDSNAQDIKHTMTRTGTKPPRIRFRPVSGWPELRDSYGTSLRPFLNELERRAVEAWAIDDLVAEFGEGIMVGRPHRVALLEPEAQAVLAGEAAHVVQLNRIEQPGVPAVLELSATSTPFDRESELDLMISYTSGLT
ncbi:MAG: hypothetical protein ACRDS9_08895, partial [Pseudonocardiaceae bacterium]